MYKVALLVLIAAFAAQAAANARLLRSDYATGQLSRD
jgi:hypothetical protein